MKTRKLLVALSVAVAGATLLVSGCGKAPEKKTAASSVVVDDATITSKIQAAIAANPDLKKSNIVVEVVKGAVKLTGTVDIRPVADLATRIARDTDGVQSVDNQLVNK